MVVFVFKKNRRMEVMNLEFLELYCEDFSLVCIYIKELVFII